jgi:streptogramin lyase
MRTRLPAALSVAVLATALTGVAMSTASATDPGNPGVFTLDADFDQGFANNVVHSTPNQLQLDDTTEAFPFIWIALSDRGTIAKIDTVTGEVKGEYSTTSDGDDAHNPSRTTVANDGSVWAGNRYQSSVIHVGNLEAGGCVDRNGNGTIETSTGYGDVLTWPGGSYGASTDVSAAEDECILHYVDTAGGDARHLSVNADGNVWVGDNSPTHYFQLLDGATGDIQRTETMPCGGYGGLIDGNGVLWSSQSGIALLRWDPALPTTPDVNPRCISKPGIYGLAFDSHNNVWASTYGLGIVYKVGPDGSDLGSFDQGHWNAQGLAVDGNDHVWVSSALDTGPNRISHLLNNGTLVGEVWGAGEGSTGVSVDAAGKIWTANRASSDATRIDPDAGPIGADGVTPVGAFDLTVPLPDAHPYNYSDMTGSTLTGAPTHGTWSVMHDSLVDGAEWGTVDWTADVPEGGALTFTVASSNDGVTWTPEETVVEGADLTVADGRYLRVTAAFARPSGGDSPILYDVTVNLGNEAPDCGAAAASQSSIWPANHRFVPINVLGVTDPDGDPVAITIGDIFQDEPVDALGDGRYAPDGQGVGTDTAEVRAERSGTTSAAGNGRFYHIVFTATDDGGLTCSGTLTVSVPHDRNKAAVDDGALYDSTVG